MATTEIRSKKPLRDYFISPGPFDPSHRYETSWLLSPGALFAYRAFLSTYAFIATFVNLGWNGTHGGTAGQSFSYFTNLTYWGLSFYFGVAATHTGTYWLTGRPLLARWPRWAQELHAIFYSTIVVFPFIVTIVFWAILFPGYFTTTFAAWYNTTAHALNSVFALLEIILPRTPLRPWWHLGPLIFLLACYLGLAYVTHATEGFYVYSFLDVQANGSGTVAGYCFGIAIGCIVLFAVVQGVVWVRVRLTEGVLGARGRWSSRDVDAAGGGAAALREEEMGAVGYSKEGLMGDEAVREK
ncbi:hypothetical protein HDK90DRAFT_68204 [Phyllosticta capitalensis]|uniref:Uncharacterized protein n=1 Tax=Phyllosticta capitalensis TaxID=121624 RepID=A0ABR1YCD6_9PEZI